MTTAERAKQMAEEWHCGKCQWRELSPLPAAKCRGDIYYAATEITALLDLLVEAREVLGGTNTGRALIERIDKALNGGTGEKPTHSETREAPRNPVPPVLEGER